MSMSMVPGKYLKENTILGKASSTLITGLANLNEVRFDEINAKGTGGRPHRRDRHSLFRPVQ